MRTVVTNLEKFCSYLFFFESVLLNLCMASGNAGLKISSLRNNSHFHIAEVPQLFSKLLHDWHGNNWEASLLAMTSHILEREFSAKEHCICLIIVSERKGDYPWRENVIQLVPSYIPIINIEFSSENFYINTSYLESLLTEALNQGCSCLLIRVSNENLFMDALSKARKSAEQRNAEKYVILIPLIFKKQEENYFKMLTETISSRMNGTATENDNGTFQTLNIGRKTYKSQEYYVSDLMGLFKTKEINFYPNILVVQKSENEGSFSILTHVYGSNQTNGNNIQEVNAWNGTKFMNECNHGNNKAKKKLSCFFIDKLSDMNGEPIVFATFNYPPYSVLEYNTSGVIENFEDGIEMRIAILLAERLNFTWSLYVDAEHFWGEIWDNGSGNGMLGAVSSEKADLAFAAIYLWDHEHHFIDFSMAYVRSGITVLAPRPLPLPQWITPFLPFSKSLWIAVILGVFISAAALFTLAHIHKAIKINEVSCQRYCDLSECILRAVGLLALAPDPTPPPYTQTGIRQLLLIWLPIWGLLLATAYSAGLSSALAIPHSQPPIDTISQLAESQLPWAGPHPAWAFSLRGATDPILRTLFNNFQVMSEEELRDRSFGRSIAYAVERLPAGNFAVGSYLQNNALEHLRLVHEDIYYEYVVTALQKSSPLRPHLDSLIGRLCEAGIPLYWEGAVSRRFPIRGANYVGIKASTPEPTALTLHLLKGPFYLLCLGLAMSLLIFIGERLWKPKDLKAIPE